MRKPARRQRARRVGKHGDRPDASAAVPGRRAAAARLGARNDEGRPEPPLVTVVRRDYRVEGPTSIFAILFVNWLLIRMLVPDFGTFTPVQPTW